MNREERQEMSIDRESELRCSTAEGFESQREQSSWKNRLESSESEENNVKMCEVMAKKLQQEFRSGRRAGG